jgi:serine/threonine protein kinase
MHHPLYPPSSLLQPSKDLLRKLLVRDPKKRLGSGDTDAAEIKCHPFFSGLNWDLLYAGSIPPPWAPKFAGSLDTSQFDQEFTSIEPVGMNHAHRLALISYLTLLLHASTPALILLPVSPDVRGAYFGSLDGAFEGFTFVDESASRMMMSSSVSARGGAGGAGQPMMSSTPMQR